MVSHEGASPVLATEHASTPGVVVAYEADSFDPRIQLGWSVVVTGSADWSPALKTSRTTRR
ncbi:MULTISPECIES: hypothetical protein [Streptomyces]|uniref:hypothetical protein n=1 Tax=Streptomyces TaxID=1883 RepID=UPI00345B4C91